MADGIIHFFAAGTPKAMSVGKTVRVPMKGKKDSWQQFQTRRNTEWAVIVGEIGRAHAPAAPLDGPLILMARFLLPRPQSIPRRSAATAMPTKKPDIDNLMSKFADHWNGIFWHDDAQLVDQLVRKRYAADGRTGVEITIAPITATRLLAELDQMALDIS